MAAKRQTISVKVRFEVFKRDSFTCQYCGKAAPDVILHVDHIQPVSKDGDNDITNLITSCQSCNLGKSNRELSDDAVISKRKKQLDELQERREQLEMMHQWYSGLIDLQAQEVEIAGKLWAELLPGLTLNDYGKSLVRGYLSKFGLTEVLDAMRAAATQYLKYEEGKITADSAGKALTYVPRICSVRKHYGDNPYMKDAFYIRGIVRNRMYCNEWKALALIKRALELGYETNLLKEFASTAHNWTEWSEAMKKITESENG